jgi:DNA repair protein RAD5
LSSNPRPGRIGVKPIQSNALLQSQKRAGTAAATIDDKSLKHFEDKPRKGPSPSKGKAKASPTDSNDEEEDSGDEAEKLDDKQMNELDAIYRRWVLFTYVPNPQGSDERREARGG